MILINLYWTLHNLFRTHPELKSLGVIELPHIPWRVFLFQTMLIPNFVKIFIVVQELTQTVWWSHQNALFSLWNKTKLQNNLQGSLLLSVSVCNRFNLSLKLALFLNTFDNWISSTWTESIENEELCRNRTKYLSSLVTFHCLVTLASTVHRAWSHWNTV